MPTAQPPNRPTTQQPIPTDNWRLPFFTIWTGQAFSLVGSALVRFALIWWLTEETGSATALAGATLVTLLPAIFLGPFAGALIDRWSRRWVMIVSDGLIALFTGILAYLFWLDVARAWHVYAILFIRALGATFQDPAMRATTSLMAPHDQLTRVAGMNQTLTGVVRIVAPPLGALLLEVTSMQLTLAVDLVTAVLAIVPLLFVPVPQPQAAPAAPAGAAGTGRRSLLGELGAGLRFVWNWRGMFWLISTAALIRFFLAPAYSFLPLLVTQHFGGGALQLGWMGSAFGVGLICGGLLLSTWGGFRRRMVTCLVGVFSYGLGMLVTGLAPANAFWLALAGSVWRGMMVPVFAGSMDAIYQASVPPEMQGRFFTLNNSVGQVMTPLSLAISGPVADALGVRTVYALGGVVCVLMPIVWAFTPTILYLEDWPGRSRQTVRE